MRHSAWLNALLATTLLTACGSGPGLRANGDASYEAAGDLASVASDIAKARLADTPDGTLVSRLPRARGEKMATVLSYRAMDNDLASALPRHLKDYERAGSSAYANLLVFSDGDRTGDSFMRYVVQDTTAALRSPYVPAASVLGLGDAAELDSAEPDVLERSIGWAFREYPGRFKVLDVASHGNGSHGICMDYASNYHQMPLAAFGDAVKHGLKGRKLDVLNLLACLMSTVEVAYEFRDTAHVLVASEDLIMGGRVMMYSKTFYRLQAMDPHQTLSAQEVGRQLVADAQPEVPSSGAYTLAAVDLDRIADVKRGLNVLSNALIASLPAHAREIIAAYDAVPVLRKDKGQSSHRDLVAFCARLAKVPDSAVQAAARDLADECDGVLVTMQAKKMEKGVANGLSLYMPDAQEEFDASYKDTRLAQDTSWPQFLLALRKAR